MNLPNFVTIMRIILLPPAIYCFFENNVILNIISLVLVIMMELTDLFDGYLARKLNRVSNVGKILDPFADHIYRLSFFLFFLIKGIIPLWMFLICFYRDSLVLNLRIFASSENKTFVAARKSGKIKAIVQSIVIMSVILIVIISYKVRIIYQAEIYYILMFICTSVTLWSAFDYFFGIVNIKVRFFNYIYFIFSILVLGLVIILNY